MTNVEMSSFIALLSDIPNRSSRIVCTSIIGNLFEQVGVPLGVGSRYGRSMVLGVGSESA